MCRTTIIFTIVPWKQGMTHVENVSELSMWIRCSRVVIVNCNHFAHFRISKVKFVIHDRLKQLQSSHRLPHRLDVAGLAQGITSFFPRPIGYESGRYPLRFAILSKDLADKQQIDKPPFCSQGVDDVWELDLFLRLQMFQLRGIRVNRFVCTAGLLDTLTRMIPSGFSPSARC